MAKPAKSHADLAGQPFSSLGAPKRKAAFSLFFRDSFLCLFCILTQLQNGLKSIMWMEYLHIDTKTTVDIVRAWKSGVKVFKII